MRLEAENRACARSRPKSRNRVRAGEKLAPQVPHRARSEYSVEESAGRLPGIPEWRERPDRPTYRGRHTTGEVEPSRRRDKFPSANPIDWFDSHCGCLLEWQLV